MEAVARQVADALRETIADEDVIGVSYYTESGVGHVYQSEWAGEKYTPEQIDEIVRDLQLGALGYGAQESRQEESLHATVRVYDELLDVVIPVTDTEGIAFALDVEGEYSLRDAIKRAEEVIGNADVERTALRGDAS